LRFRSGVLGRGEREQLAALIVTLFLAGEITALVVEALAYALLSRPRKPARAVAAPALGHLLSFTLGPALGAFIASSR